MRIAVLSDARMPTSWAYPGHGLGKANLAIAEGLARRGHEVTLYGGHDSHSDVVAVECCGGERVMVQRVLADGAVDVVIDGGHEHQYQEVNSVGAMLNLSHDRERNPGKNAVYPSLAHAKYFGALNPVVVYHGVAVPGEAESGRGMPRPYGDDGDGTYLLFLGDMSFWHKGVRTAIRVAREAGVPLLLAGPGNMQHEGYVGPVSGNAKRGLLAGAKAVLQMGRIEAAGLVCIEAAAVGTPTIARNAGGLAEYVWSGVTGYLCDDEAAMVEAVGFVDGLDRGEIIKWVRANRHVEQMINGYEELLARVVDGETW